MNRLEFADASGDPELRGRCKLLAPGEPRYWKPGHPIGYEHTFTSSLADFLAGLDAGEAARPTFADGLAVQRVLDAIEASAARREWVATGL